VPVGQEPGLGDLDVRPARSLGFSASRSSISVDTSTATTRSQTSAAASVN
jgi:hypothetical protein